MAAHGFLNLLKPAGISSHHCVVKVRKLLRTKQVGHGGTLDPMATGVLTMALGDATKFLQYLAAGKEYTGVVRFGVTTDTDDVTGKTMTERPVPWLSEKEVEKTLQRFVGTIDQMPPRISAIRKNGVRMYELARANSDIDVTPRRVHISQINLLNFTPGQFPEAKIHVDCGSGTYIRSIARECGEAILVPPGNVDETCELKNANGEFCIGGTLAALERTRNGAFTLTDSISLEELEHVSQNARVPLQSIESALLHLPYIVLPSNATHRWVIGGIVRISKKDSTHESGHVTLVDGAPVRVYEGFRGRKTFRGVSRIEQQPEGDQFILRKRTFV